MRAGPGKQPRTPRVIEEEILMHLRSVRKRSSEVSLYDPIGVDREGNEITLIDVLGSDPDQIDDHVVAHEELSAVLQRIRQLGDQERRVLELRYGLRTGERKTQREVARMLGISRSYVSRLEKRGIEGLKHHLSLAERRKP